MRCYVDNKPCTCELDDIAAHACVKDTASDRGPHVSEDIPDPFRAGEIGLDDHLFYLNGMAA